MNDLTVSLAMGTTAGSLERAPAVKKYDCPTLQNKSTNGKSRVSLRKVELIF